jgi:hypothetical protein
VNVPSVPTLTSLVNEPTFLRSTPPEMILAVAAGHETELDQVGVAVLLQEPIGL